MIEINLLPGSVKRTKSRGGALGGSALKGLKLPQFDRTLAVVVALWVFGVGGAAWMHFTSAGRIADAQTALEAAQRDSARYHTIIQRGDSLRAQEALISQKLEVIQQIDAGRFMWPHILDEVSAALPPYIWLTSMRDASPDPNITRVRVEGRAGNYFALGRFIEQLERSPFLHQVKLIGSERSVVAERNVYTFALEAGVQEAPPDVIQTVPLFGAQTPEE
ncbi:MAG TPA: PilN domain-containing protein [Longimicrobiales bacterium]|nr:PilN domain-containing protein [Longimicrobiales bacterium]